MLGCPGTTAVQSPALPEPGKCETDPSSKLPRFHPGCATTACWGRQLFFGGGGGNDWDLPLGGKSRILVVFRFSVVLFVCFLFLKAEAPCAVQAGFKLTVAC